MTIRKFYTFRVNDSTPDDHTGRLGEITYRDGFLYYHDGSTPGGEIIGGGGNGGGPTSWSSITGKPTFAAVATSGSYADLTNKPNLFSGAYADLTGKPDLFSGSYTDLTNKPTIPSLDGYATEAWVQEQGFGSGTFTGDYNDLTNKPVISDTTSLIGGDFFIAKDSTTLVLGQWAAQTLSISDQGIILGGTGGVRITGAAGSGIELGGGSTGGITFSSATTGIDYNDLSNLPTIPSLDGYATEAWVNAQGFGTGGSGVSLPANASGYLTNDGAGNLAWAAGDGTFSGDYNDLVNKPTIPSSLSDLTNDIDALTPSTVGQFVPDNLSEFNNDAGFITLADVPTGFSGSYTDLTNTPTIPADIADLTDNSNLLGSGSNLEIVAGDGIAVDTVDGVVTISASNNATPQYGYFTELTETNSSNQASGGAVVMDSDGNSYVGYTYYDNNINNDVSGVMKISNTGEQQWAVNIASQNGDARNPEIASLELVDIDGTTSLIALGSYYDNNANKDVAFIYYIDPTNGSINESLDNGELVAPVGMNVRDGVAGYDGSNPYVVVVGETYDQTVTKTFTPMAGSTTDKLFVSWADFAASGVNSGEQVYYYDGGNNYGVNMNAVGVSATTAGSTDPAWAGISIIVSTTESGNYTITGVNGWGWLVNSWPNPVTLTVPGSALGGVDGPNDMTFDFNNAVFNNDSANIQAAVSNIMGTPPVSGGVYCPAYGGYDWSTQVGNALTFNYQLNNQAYIGRFGQSGGWTKNFGGSNYDRLNSVVVDGNLNTYAVGYAWNGSRGAIVVKYDYEGSQVWAVYIDPSDNTGSTLMSVDLLSDGNLITVDENGVVTKVDSDNGNIIWQVKADNDPSWDGDFRGTATPDGDYIITNYEDDDYTQYVMRVSGSDGSSVWNKRISRTDGNDNGEINADDDTQYIDCNATSLTIAGRSYPPNGNTVGLVYNFPISGENIDGTYGQFVISSESMNWTTKSTTSVAATVNNTDISVTTNETTPTSNASIISESITRMGGEEVASTGDITFNGSKLSSPAPGYPSEFPLGVITLAPGNGSNSEFANYGQFINVYPTVNYDQPHIHIAAGHGNNSNGDLILGDDNYHVDINHNGSIYIKTNGQNYAWTFDDSGNLTLPYGGDIRDNNGNSVLGGSGTTLPTDASGYLNNDGSGTLTWVPGNPSGSGMLPYNSVTVLSNTSVGDWTEYTLSGTMDAFYDWNNTYTTITLSSQTAYGKEIIVNTKNMWINDSKINSNDYLVIAFPETPAVGDVFSIPVVNILNTVNAGSFVVGETYTISSVGTTNWTSIGASYGAVGQSFVATGTGTGTGTATTVAGAKKLIFKPATGQRAQTMAQGQLGPVVFGQGGTYDFMYVDLGGQNAGNPITWVYAGVIGGIPTWYQFYF